MKLSRATWLGFALLIAGLAGCPATSDTPGQTVVLLSSEGTRANLAISDQSGLLSTAKDAGRPESDGEFEVEAVPGAIDELRLSWVSSPCLEAPELTIIGESLSELQLILDGGQLAEDVECPDIGVVYSVLLAFNGEVSVDDVIARRVGN